MRLNYLESFVEIFLHGLVINQMLLELLGKFGTQNLEIFSLFRSFRAYFDNFFIDISAEEMSPFCRVLLGILDFF